MRKTVLIFVYCLLSIAFSFGQNSKLDSLLFLLETDKPDTNKLHHLNKIASIYTQRVMPDSGLYYANKALELIDQLSDNTNGKELKRMIESARSGVHNTLGNAYLDQGNYSKALADFLLCLSIRKSAGDKKGVSVAYNNIGIVYRSQGNYPEALKNYFESLKIKEQIDDEKGIAFTYGNIGNVYMSQGNYPEALKNHLASLEIEKRIGNKKGIAQTYNNIGNVYAMQGDFDTALAYYRASLEIKLSIEDKMGIAQSHNNIGNVYYEKALREKSPALRGQKMNEAVRSFKSGLEIREAIGDKTGIAASCSNIGDGLKMLKKFNEAEAFLLRSLKLSKSIGYMECTKNTYGILATLDSAKGNYKGAFEYHKSYILYRDSLDNEESRKRTIQSQMSYEFEKKEAVAAVEHKKELENQEMLAAEESRKQSLVLLFVIGTLLLVIVFAGFVFRSLRLTRKQKKIIEEQKNIVELQKKVVEQQKELVEEKQRAIIDSIMYARRIQQSLLPTAKYIEQSLKRLNKK